MDGHGQRRKEVDANFAGVYAAQIDLLHPRVLGCLVRRIIREPILVSAAPLDRSLALVAKERLPSGTLAGLACRGKLVLARVPINAEDALLRHRRVGCISEVAKPVSE